jgi:hypothetical protein
MFLAYKLKKKSSGPYHTVLLSIYISAKGAIISIKGVVGYMTVELKNMLLEIVILAWV